MRISIIKHVDFEGPGVIEEWIKNNGYSFKITHPFLGERFLLPHEFDALFIMGGPMGVYDEREYPFLSMEKRFIERAIKENKFVMGICLGAQLIADVLGARVYKNEFIEVGWFPVRLTEEGVKSEVFKDFPREFTPFHWHSDIFEVPSKGWLRIGESDACKNQGFMYSERVLALQFHLEITYDGVLKLIENSLLLKGRYVQSKEEMLKEKERFKIINNLMFTLLNNFLTQKGLKEKNSS